MNRSSASQRSRSAAAGNSESPLCSSSLYTSPTLPPQAGSVKLPMLASAVNGGPRSPSSSTGSNGSNGSGRASASEGQSVTRLSIENIHLTHQNGTLARELAHSRYTIHALRQIVGQREASEQRIQQDLKQSLWRVRVLEAVVGRMSEQLVLLMGEQRGGFDEGTDIVGLAREVAVGEFYRQHAALQQRELEAIRGELDVHDEEEDYDPEEDYEDDHQEPVGAVPVPSSSTMTTTTTVASIADHHPQDLTGKTSPPPPMITVTDSDADQEQSSSLDNDPSPSSSSSEDDDLEDYLEDADDQYTAAPPVRNLATVGKVYDAEPPVVVEERPGLRADVLFARMRVVSSEV